VNVAPLAPSPTDPDDAALRFGSLLRSVRTRASMSQEALAVAIGANDLQRISEAENGVRRLKPAALAQLLDQLATPAERIALAESWIVAQGELPLDLREKPHPLALQVAVSFSAWWPTLARGESKAARAALSVMRWALAKLGEPPA
jgi:transcriptional regulator with XRE-family HTH domain